MHVALPTYLQLTHRRLYYAPPYMPHMYAARFPFVCLSFASVAVLARHIWGHGLMASAVAPSGVQGQSPWSGSQGAKSP